MLPMSKILLAMGEKISNLSVVMACIDRFLDLAASANCLRFALFLALAVLRAQSACGFVDCSDRHISETSPPMIMK